MKHIPRFYLSSQLREGERLSLLPDQMHHASVVLRLSVGDIVRVFNPPFGEWNCKIVDLKSRFVECVSQFRESQIEDGPIIACSLINPKRFEFILEKATELGVKEIIPIISSYTQYKDINLKKSEQKIIYACEQSQRISIPILHEVTKIENFLLQYLGKYKILVGDEKSSNKRLEDVMEKKCICLIGPEGGFSDDEYNLFDTYKNLHKFRINKNILRSETAAIAFTAIWGCKFLQI